MSVQRSQEGIKMSSSADFFAFWAKLCQEGSVKDSADPGFPLSREETLAGPHIQAVMEGHVWLCDVGNDHGIVYVRDGWVQVPNCSSRPRVANLLDLLETARLKLADYLNIFSGRLSIGRLNEIVGCHPNLYLHPNIREEDISTGLRNVIQNAYCAVDDAESWRRLARVLNKWLLIQRVTKDSPVVGAVRYGIYGPKNLKPLLQPIAAGEMPSGPRPYGNG